MPYTQAQHQRMQLDRWMRYHGYADFNTYLASGGSVIEAVSVLRNLQDSVTMALIWLDQYSATIHADTKPILHDPVIDNPNLPPPNGNGDLALAVAEAEVTGEHDVDPVDPGNAHPQGDDNAAA